MSFNVLIVDDSDVIRAMISRTLMLAHVPVGRVHHASNGREALAILGQEWIDLVLADINMPVMNGAELIGHMRGCPEMADIAVIVVSSEAATERVSGLMQHGVTAWIRKPFTPEEIRNAICSLADSLVPASERAVRIDAVFGPVLETFAFVCPEPVSADHVPEVQDDLFCASIAFTGASNGVLTVSAPSELCVELTANVLGTDPDDADAQMRGADVLGEIANIAAGHLASLMSPSRATDLHPPIVSQLDLQEWQRQLANPSARTFLVEQFPVVVTLEVRANKAAH